MMESQSGLARALQESEGAKAASVAANHIFFSCKTAVSRPRVDGIMNVDEVMQSEGDENEQVLHNTKHRSPNFSESKAVTVTTSEWW